MLGRARCSACLCIHTAQLMANQRLSPAAFTVSGAPEVRMDLTQSLVVMWYAHHHCTRLACFLQLFSITPLLCFQANATLFLCHPVIYNADLRVEWFRCGLKR